VTHAGRVARTSRATATPAAAHRHTVCTGVGATTLACFPGRSAVKNLSWMSYKSSSIASTLCSRQRPQQRRGNDSKTYHISRGKRRDGRPAQAPPAAPHTLRTVRPSHVAARQDGQRDTRATETAAALCTSMHLEGVVRRPTQRITSAIFLALRRTAGLHRAVAC
jgi:hypothetical protein